MVWYGMLEVCEGAPVATSVHGMVWYSRWYGMHRTELNVVGLKVQRCLGACS